MKKKPLKMGIMVVGVLNQLFGKINLILSVLFKYCGGSNVSL